MRLRANTLLPTIDWVRWGLAPALVFIVAGLDRGYQTDFWHHLARGREIAVRGQIVDTDLFTFTIAGQPIRDANWLTQVIYYRVFTWGGLPLVQLANAIALSLTLLILVRICRKTSGSFPAAAVAGVLVFLGLWQLLLIRPQTISFLLFVLMYWVLVDLPKRKVLVIVPPLIMALWANTHGGFAIGLVSIAAFAGAEVIASRKLKLVGEPKEIDDRTAGKCPRHYLVTFLLSASATLLNPYGWRVYQYAGVVASRAAGRHIEEWLAPLPTTWVGQAFLASILGLCFLYWRVGRRPRVRELCLIVCFLPLAARSVRMVAWWWLAIAPTLATLFAEILWRRQPGASHAKPSWAARALVVLLAVACGFSIPQAERWNPLFRRVRESHRVESDLQTLSPELADSRVFARLEWGEYLDWSLGPPGRLFMDGRIEAYPDPVWRDYCTITSASAGWQGVLDRYGVDRLLLDQTYHHELIRAVEGSGFWRESGRAGRAVTFMRRRAPGGVAVVQP